ncbi:uncharacterized protein LAESUDRAFT_640702 [Laetiporus sulphureus 93-53]|uniref:Methyltransferase domain-containing protein n=1 Tax=Laetiporus sulphureus 93-53 TaxID=1314785 RepID=A0A165HNQ2_9APHY|nr:uncharacterized protein LAESUDRAFT_640702 [Laetiporus sulphureus 93-53]KZT11979.1 hypothetical protein LAESUDRAFT_640702 [Laetiporus sulphureus 93-53]
MSRGSREATSGILKGSMRDNYSEHGVEQYYKKVGATYRNPHFPGVRSCIFSWLNRWWATESNDPRSHPEKLVVFDMACGDGEVTLSVLEWWQLSQTTAIETKHTLIDDMGEGKERVSALRKLRARELRPVTVSSQLPRPTVLAADPFTAEAYHARASLHCSPLSFRQIAEGALPVVCSSNTSSDEQSNGNEDVHYAAEGDDTLYIDMVICSFALHLIETPSELFALLWELSTKCRWLVVIAPHKKPDIKDGWGWCKWNVETWTQCPMNESQGEFLQERVHCRIYRSLNAY